MNAIPLFHGSRTVQVFGEKSFSIPQQQTVAGSSGILPHEQIKPFLTNRPILSQRRVPPRRERSERDRAPGDDK